jgi:para-aminobenzoate synthetase component 1
VREDGDVFDLLTACFPGGSITGAPKIRAMQIIDELEPVARSAYCGSIGYIGLDGSACFNIAIRTLVQSGRTLHAWAGGAITADSRADQEFDEIHAKAAAMLRAMGCEDEAGEAVRTRRGRAAAREVAEGQVPCT